MSWLPVLFYFAACTEEPPAPAPAMNWEHAVSLLEHDGWTITASPTEDAADDACVRATRAAETGEVCFRRCAGRSLQAIHAEYGGEYAYQIGDEDDCASFTSFTGSEALRRVVATEANMTPYLPTPDASEAAPAAAEPQSTPPIPE